MKAEAPDPEERGPVPEFGPVVGVGAFVEHEGRVLLIRRGKAPGEGLWAIPGGRQRHGESVAQAAEREVFEETSVQIRAHEMVYCFETMFDRAGVDIEGARVLHGPGSQHLEQTAGQAEPAIAAAYHYLIIDLRGEYLGGTPRPGDDARDARWFTPDELREIRAQIQAGTAAFLKDAGFL